MIVGIGTDLAECARIERLFKLHGEHFQRRVLTHEECAECDGISYLAGRWCAKEALAKALGTGIGAQCAFEDICVLRDSASGRPVMTLSGNAKRTAEKLGVKRIHLSISHEKHYAVATVILERSDPDSAHFSSGFF